MENIKYLSKNKIPLSIATVLHSRNIDRFDKFIALIKKIKPVTWLISPIIPSGRGQFNNEIKESYTYYNRSFWQKIVKKCNAAKVNVKLIDLPFNMQAKRSLDYFECGAALSFCEINADGQVSPCTLCRTCMPPSAIQFDSLKTKTIKQIWNDSAFNKFRAFMTQGCEGCKAFVKCNKCIAQSFAYFKNGYSPAPYCISNPLIKLKKKKVYIKQLKIYSGINTDEIHKACKI